MEENDEAQTLTAAKNADNSTIVQDGQKKDSTDSSTIQPFEWLTSPYSLKSLVCNHALLSPSSVVDPSHCKALHVGSGSSTVGEFLIEELGYGKVVDVDRDSATLEKMWQRWQKRCKTTHVDPSRLDICALDFTTATLPYPNNYFDLVLDKSTLDCTLCSENATSSLLCQVYQSLAIGGVYLLISFHELELLFPLLKDLPGAVWKVTSATLQRQVETICRDTAKTSSQSNTTHSTKPLTVLIARKLAAASRCNSELNYDNVCQHIHAVSDAWFQKHQPLLTRTRTQELQKAFQTPLPLEKAYLALFTDAEREHLTYDHFLEDWEAFLDQQLSSKTIYNKTTISCETAVSFLNEMQ